MVKTEISEHKIRFYYVEHFRDLCLSPNERLPNVMFWKVKYIDKSILKMQKCNEMINT